MTYSVERIPVSVVIPCFQCAGTLERAFMSIAVQTRRPVEVILVVDGSNDGTWDVASRLSAENPGWVKAVWLPVNRGVAMARNAAWELAGQPYIAFLDADDAWHPKKLEIQYAFMVAHPEVTLSGHEYRMLQQGDELDWGVPSFAIESISKWALLLSNRFVTPSVMVRSNIPQRFVEQQRYMEDHMLWLKIVCSGAKVAKLDVPLAAIFKAPFGADGLSSEIWRMGRSDLGNYRRLFQEGLLSFSEVAFLVVFSMLKFLRRLFVYWGYLRWKK